MSAIDQHMLKVRSSVDGREIPFHVSAPSQLPKSPLPFAFLLHDFMADPAPGAFIEEAFRRAEEWRTTLAEGPPALLVQTWGRGNASWFGPAGRALFDVWEELQDHFRIAPTAAVLGTGAGGEGAIQLAAHFPNRFHAVAAVNPWTDDRLNLPLGTNDFPAWESAGRTEVRPIELAVKLAGRFVALAHVPFGDALSALAAARHFAAMTDSLAKSGVEWRDFSVKPNPFSDRPPKLDYAELWRSLLAAPVGERTSTAFPKRLFWRPLAIVVGSLGETAENEAMRCASERLRTRWLAGEDSCHPQFGDRRLIQEIPIVVDAEAADAAPDGDLLILGSPRLNLLARKWSDRLPVRWPANDADDFAVLGRTFANPRAFAVARKRRPDGNDGAVWIATTCSAEGWVDLDRLWSSFLPTTFVQAKPGELLWMNDEDEE